MREVENSFPTKIGTNKLNVKQMISDLVDTSNKFFRGLKTKEFISEKI